MPLHLERNPVNKWFRKSAIAVAVSAALVLTACGTTAPTTESTTIDELRVVMPTVKGLDLTAGFDVQSHTAISVALEGLMTFDSDGALVPNLATKVDNPDETTYVYTIREGVKFWDGSDMTTEDVAYSISRNLIPESQIAARFATVDSVDFDDTTVTVKLKSANANWQYVPAMYVHVISKAYAEAHVGTLGTPSALTMGTGAFEPVSFKADAGLEFERNKDWWGGDVKVEKVSITFSSDPAAAALSMRSGEVDLALNVDATAYDSLKDVTLLSASVGDQTVMGFNVNSNQFADVHVRRAVAYATDTKGIAQASVGKYGQASKTIVPPSNWSSLLSEAEVTTLYGTLPSYEFDLTKARAELAKSSTPNGFSFSARVLDSDPNMRLAGEVMVKNLAEIGIELKLEIVPAASWLEELYGPRDSIEMMFLSFGGSIPDPDKFLFDWLSSSNAREAGLNTSDFKNAEVDSLLAQERGSLDAKERIDAFTRILEITAEELPYIPLYTTNKTSVLANGLAWDGSFFGLFYMTSWPTKIVQP